MKLQRFFSLLCVGAFAADLVHAGLCLKASATDNQTPVAGSSSTNSNAVAGPCLIIVGGAFGAPEYESNFLHQARLWTDAGKRGQASIISIGQTTEDPSHTDFEALKQTLEQQSTDGTEPLWLVLIGHGTFDGKEARFNLRGPDVTATDLAAWLKPFHRPIVLVDCSSASAPFLNKLSATNRVIVTATRSGNEQNFARFGQYFAEALTGPENDLDKDSQISVLESFLAASARVAEFYKNEGRLATEHALLDDNGDGLGTPADFFRGVRPFKKPDGGAGVDGARAQQMHLIPSDLERSLAAGFRAQRDAVELQITRLRESKANVPEAQYYKELETLLGDLINLYGDQL